MGRVEPRHEGFRGKEKNDNLGSQTQALFEGSESLFLSHDCLLVLSLAKCLEEGMLVIYFSKLNSSRRYSQALKLDNLYH